MLLENSFQVNRYLLHLVCIKLRGETFGIKSDYQVLAVLLSHIRVQKLFSLSLSITYLQPRVTPRDAPLQRNARCSTETLSDLAKALAKAAPCLNKTPSAREMPLVMR